jgi:hypothetical protein
VKTGNDEAVTAGHSADPGRWLGLLDKLMGTIARDLGRLEPADGARAFVLELLSDLPRKNCWTIAELAGDASPDGMQARRNPRSRQHHRQKTRKFCACICREPRHPRALPVPRTSLTCKNSRSRFSSERSAPLPCR